jgi:hypothetical protein
MAKYRKPKEPGEKSKTKAPLDKEALRAKVVAAFQNAFAYEDAPRAKRFGPKSLIKVTWPLLP